MFETFNAPAFDTAAQAVLSYIKDRTTGIALDGSAGNGVSCILPIYTAKLVPDFLCHESEALSCL